jgi:hypothetical protein
LNGWLRGGGAGGTVAPGSWLRYDLRMIQSLTDDSSGSKSRGAIYICTLLIVAIVATRSSLKLPNLLFEPLGGVDTAVGMSVIPNWITLPVLAMFLFMQYYRALGAWGLEKIGIAKFAAKEFDPDLAELATLIKKTNEIVSIVENRIQIEEALNAEFYEDTMTSLLRFEAWLDIDPEYRGPEPTSAILDTDLHLVPNWNSALHSEFIAKTSEARLLGTLLSKIEPDQIHTILNAALSDSLKNNRSSLRRRKHINFWLNLVIPSLSAFVGILAIVYYFWPCV